MVQRNQWAHSWAHPPRIGLDRSTGTICKCLILWCRRRESNPHGSEPHGILRARLRSRISPRIAEILPFQRRQLGWRWTGLGGSGSSRAQSRAQSPGANPSQAGTELLWVIIAETAQSRRCSRSPLASQKRPAQSAGRSSPLWLVRRRSHVIHTAHIR